MGENTTRPDLRQNDPKQLKHAKSSTGRSFTSTGVAMTCALSIIGHVTSSEVTNSQVTNRGQPKVLPVRHNTALQD